MRPVNLIPLDQRRGAARRGAGGSKPLSGYIVLGVLGAGVLCVLALVLTSNQVNDKAGQVASLRAKEAGAKSVADTLRPYGSFAMTQTARQTQIEQVVQGRFDWDHAVDQLARTTPPNVWLLTVSGTMSPGIEVAGAGGSASTVRGAVDGPAFTLVGCTYSQRAVARMMVRMNNLDGVTDVKLAKSAKRDDGVSGGAPAAAGGAAAGTPASEQEDCVGSSRVTKFELMVGFGAAPTTSAATATGGVPQGSAAQLAKAQDTAAQAQPGAATTPASGGGP